MSATNQFHVFVFRKQSEIKRDENEVIHIGLLCKKVFTIHMQYDETILSEKLKGWCKSRYEPQTITTKGKVSSISYFSTASQNSKSTLINSLHSTHRCILVGNIGLLYKRQVHLRVLYDHVIALSDNPDQGKGRSKVPNLFSRSGISVQMLLLSRSSGDYRNFTQQSTWYRQIAARLGTCIRFFRFFT